MCARAQIAPLRLPASTTLSVPKMEVNSIWLGAKAVDEVLQNFEIRIKSTTILTDSETAFYWTQASPLYLDRYVAGKVDTGPAGREAHIPRRLREQPRGRQ